MREVISTKDAPQAIRAYSRRSVRMGWFSCRGQVPVDPGDAASCLGDVAAQTERVLRNLSAILKAANSGLEKVVRLTVYLKNINEFGAMNESLCAAFHLNAAGPATVEVARLPKDVLVEIDVIALT